MDEFADLLAAIRAQPDEDARRLGTADWLDENGESEWAEFVRVQIRISQMVASDEERTDEYDDEFTRLIARERELRAGPMTYLFGQLLSGSYGSDVGPDLEMVARGFPDVIDCVTSWWINRGDDLLTWLPIYAVGLWTVPVLNEDVMGIVIVGDVLGTHFLRQEALAEQQPDERIELAICRLRWPGVRFELLLNELELEPHTPDPPAPPPRPIQPAPTADELSPDFLQGRVITATHGPPTQP